MTGLYTCGATAPEANSVLVLALNEGVTFRPHRIRTNVTAPGQAEIKSLAVGVQEQLMGPLDAWLWSLTLLDQVRAEFWKAHGLEDATGADRDRFLMKHDLSEPDPGRIDLPTFRHPTQVQLSGTWAKGFSVMLLGPGICA